MVKKLIVVGVGGMAKDLYPFLLQNPKWQLKGILVDDYKDYQSFDTQIPYLGKIREYDIDKHDYFFIAVGENPGRRELIDYFTGKDARFATFVHPLAMISPSAKIEEGCIIGPFNSIGSNAVIGANTFINKYCNVGHDAKIGENVIMYPYVMVGGHCTIGRNTVLSTRATVTPKTIVGDCCTIAIHTYIKKHLESHTFAYSKQDLVKKRKNKCADL